MRRFVHVPHRDLVRTPVILSPLAVDLFRTGPAFRRPEHDHGPERPCVGAPSARAGLDAPNVLQNGVERGGHELMHRPGITPFDEIGGVAVPAKQVIQFVVTDTGQHGGIRDLVSV